MFLYMHLEIKLFFSRVRICPHEYCSMIKADLFSVGFVFFFSPHFYSMDKGMKKQAWKQNCTSS